MITVVCCVCGEVLGTKPGGNGKSHGFCIPHLKEWMEEAKENLATIRRCRVAGILSLRKGEKSVFLVDG
jgi:hypothetical protein